MGCAPCKSQVIYLIGLVCGPHSLALLHTHTHTRAIVILSMKQLPPFFFFANATDFLSPSVFCYVIVVMLNVHCSDHWRLHLADSKQQASLKFQIFSLCFRVSCLVDTVLLTSWCLATNLRLSTMSWVTVTGSTPKILWTRQGNLLKEVLTRLWASHDSVSGFVTLSPRLWSRCSLRATAADEIEAVRDKLNITDIDQVVDRLK